MKNKIIFIVTFIILFLVIIGIYNFSNHKEEEKITNSNNQVNEENINNIENSSKENISEEKVNNINNTTSSTNEEITEISHISPSGFMGSSFYRAVLYSNGNVYVQTFDGNGYEKENIVSEELVAKNVNSIKAAEEEENYGKIIIYGGEGLNSNFGWITFE